MKKIILVMVLLFSVKSFSQIDIAAGMGISFVNNPSLNRYLENNWAIEEIYPFTSTVEFYIELDYLINPSFQLGIEDAITIFSFHGYANYAMEYTHHKPSLLAYYVINGEGYKFKFGGGAGIRFIDLDEKIIIAENYNSSGIGLLARAQGHTKLGGNFFANVGSTMRFDFPGEPSNGDNKIKNNDGNVNINSFSVSVDIGISYFF